MQKLIVDALNWRYAVKSFDPDKAVSESNLNILLETLRLTPSSFGLQPWKIVVVSHDFLKKELFKVSYNQEQVLNASHVIVICAQKSLGYVDIEKYIDKVSEVRDVDIDSLEEYKKMMVSSIDGMSKDRLQEWLALQCYIALGFLLYSCSLLEIDSCPMEGFVREEYDRILGLKKLGLTSVIACPIGYRCANDKYSHQKKVRYGLNELVVYA